MAVSWKPALYRVQPNASMQQTKVDGVGHGEEANGGKGTPRILYTFISNPNGRRQVVSPRAPRQGNIMEGGADERDYVKAWGHDRPRGHVRVPDENSPK